jgi:hypothetical protein
MANKLKSLLSLPTLKRTVKDYESMYDDFVHFANGSRIDKKFAIPDGKKNADYHFDLDQFEIILELKQLNKYSKFNTVDQYFSEQLSKGKIKRFERLPNNEIRISPDSLGKSDWNDFYKRFRPSVSNNLKDAAIQLRDTEARGGLGNLNSRLSGYTAPRRRGQRRWTGAYDEQTTTP